MREERLDYLAKANITKFDVYSNATGERVDFKGGIVELSYFAMEGLTAPAHIPILGIVSLITAFLIFKMIKCGSIFPEGVHQNGFMLFLFSIVLED